MNQDLLMSLRAEWWRLVFSVYKAFRWAMLVFILAGAWLIPVMFGDAFGIASKTFPIFALLSNLSYLGYILLLAPYVLLMTLPLALASAGPYPTRSRVGLNPELTAWLQSHNSDSRK